MSDLKNPNACQHLQGDDIPGPALCHLCALVVLEERDREIKRLEERNAQTLGDLGGKLGALKEELYQANEKVGSAEMLVAEIQEWMKETGEILPRDVDLAYLGLANALKKTTPTRKCEHGNVLPETSSGWCWCGRVQDYYEEIEALKVEIGHLELREKVFQAEMAMKDKIILSHGEALATVFNYLCEPRSLGAQVRNFMLYRKALEALAAETKKLEDLWWAAFAQVWDDICDAWCLKADFQKLCDEDERFRDFVQGCADHGIHADTTPTRIIGKWPESAQDCERFYHQYLESVDKSMRESARDTLVPPASTFLTIKEPT